MVRYRYLNMYARLPPEPQRKEPQIDVIQDTQEEAGTRPGMANYLDEFLSAIKVFGYLERHVFHELTRSMQTRKLIAGETLLLEEEKGFCLVVDGLVQIFVKSNKELRPRDSVHTLDDKHEDDARDGRQGYQLLTEVKNGAPMSSLFSVLSLFTEDVKLRHDTDPTLDDQYTPPSMGDGTPDVGFESPTKTPSSPPEQDGHQLQYFEMNGRFPSVPPLSLDEARSARSHRRLLSHAVPHNRRPRPKSAHPDIVARATVDTMIAIIPATAFRRLTRVYPKATAHIVQVILSRLQRVTLATAYSYLGLTSEVLSIEKHMEKYTNYDLPNHLRGHALERLKIKFQSEKDRLGPGEDSSKGIALHNPHIGKRRRSISSARRDLLWPLQTRRMRNSFSFAPGSDTEEGNFNVSPGDLLTNIQSSRFPNRKSSSSIGRESGQLGPSLGEKEILSPLSTSTRPYFERPANAVIQRQQSFDEDEHFRRSILDCITKAIGLTDVKNAMFPKGAESVDHSPKLIPFESRRHHSLFSNAFGFIGSYEGSVDGETESAKSTTGHTPLLSVSSNISDELIDDIEIVFFPQDALLEEQGETNPALY